MMKKILLLSFIFLCNKYNFIESRPLSIRNNEKGSTIWMAKDNLALSKIDAPNAYNDANFSNNKSMIKIALTNSSGLLDIYTLNINQGSTRIPVIIKHNNPVATNDYELILDYTAEPTNS